MKTFIIIYAIGIVLNALMAASIWDELLEEKQLVKVRMMSVVMFIMLSFITWAYAMGYLLYKFIRNPKRKDK